MRRLRIVLFLMVMVNNNVLFSQPSGECRVVKEFPNGCLLVQVGNKTYFAITETIEREMLDLKRDLLDAERKILLKDSLLSSYDLTIAMCDTTISNLKNYIRDLEEVLNGYKGLLHDYKKLKEPLFKLAGGLGVTSKDYKPAAFMGLGIKDFRVWGIFQERNSGVMVGKEFRIF